MRASDIFGLVVRLVGFFLFLWALSFLMWGLLQLVGLEVQERPDEMTDYFQWAALYGAPAIYFLRGAPLLMRFCYPETNKPPATHGQQTTDIRETK